MSSRGTTSEDRIDRLVAACESLVVRPSADAQQRNAQMRLAALSLAMPVLFAPLGWALLAPGAGVTLGVAFAFASIALGVLALSAVSYGLNASGSTRLLMTAAAVQGAVVIAAAGGLAAPMAALLGLLPALGWLVSGRRRMVLEGAAAALVGAALAAAIGATGSLHAPALPAISAIQWLVPLCLAALVLPHLAKMAEPVRGASDLDIVEASSKVAAVRLSLQGDVIDAGERAAARLGIALDHLCDDGLFLRLHVADRVSWLSALADLREGNAFRALDVRLKVDGVDAARPVYRAFAAELSLARSGAGEVIAVLRDASAAAETKARLDQALGVVEAGEIAKSRMLAVVSHELRTPLNSIIGFSDLMLHEIAGPFADPRQRDYLSLVRETGMHLLGVVTSVLDLSKLEAGTYRAEIETFDLCEAIDLSRAMLDLPAQGKSLRLVTAVAPGLSAVRADRRAVQQILINLISNAIKFSQTGATVTVSAEQSGSRIRLSVADTGIGIAECDLSRLGTPFTQIDDARTRGLEGAGLGLALVKELVAAQGGTMMIESAPGEGTTVTVTLPLDAVPAAMRRIGSKVVSLGEAKGEDKPHAALRKAG